MCIRDRGGSDPGLRLECGERLEKIGFDGYGFGGWPLDSEGKLRLDVLKMAADAMPDHKLKYAMGLGKPEEIVQCVEMGYRLFDCVIPTREARHNRLYAFLPGMATAEGVRSGKAFYRYLYPMDADHCRDGKSEMCIRDRRSTAYPTRFSMYLTMSSTVLIWLSISSSTVISYSASRSMMSIIILALSAPRSSTRRLSGLTSAALTGSCWVMYSTTFS